MSALDGKNAFDLFYKFSVQHMAETAIHEMAHFVWFYIWYEHFQDDPAEYDNPHIKWLLSELVVDVIVKNSALSEFYHDAAHQQDIGYSYFYGMEIAGAPILETLGQMYRDADDIITFMTESYKYVCDNETELRTKIAAAEQ